MQFQIARVGINLLDDQGNLLRNIQRHRDPDDWAAYVAHRKSGGALLPMPQPAPPEVSLGERVSRLRRAIDYYYDSRARTAGFRGMADALVHTGFASAWRTKAVAVGQWEVACRTYVDQVRQDVISGARSMPTAAELIAELPALVLP